MNVCIVKVKVMKGIKAAVFLFESCDDFFFFFDGWMGP